MHEVGHALGVGTVWAERGCVSGCAAGSGSPSFYLCKAARREYAATPGCRGDLPVETRGPEGSACAHFSEAGLGIELMTPRSYTGDMPLSRITLGAIEDLVRAAPRGGRPACGGRRGARREERGAARGFYPCIARTPGHPVPAPPPRPPLTRATVPPAFAPIPPTSMAPAASTTPGQIPTPARRREHPSRPPRHMRPRQRARPASCCGRAPSACPWGRARWRRPTGAVLTRPLQGAPPTRPPLPPRRPAPTETTREASIHCRAAPLPCWLAAPTFCHSRRPS
jgi:hypothetical protein